MPNKTQRHRHYKHWLSEWGRGQKRPLWEGWCWAWPGSWLCPLPELLGYMSSSPPCGSHQALWRGRAHQSGLKHANIDAQKPTRIHNDYITLMIRLRFYTHTHTHKHPSTYTENPFPPPPSPPPYTYITIQGFSVHRLLKASACNSKC